MKKFLVIALLLVSVSGWGNDAMDYFSEKYGGQFDTFFTESPRGSSRTMVFTIHQGADLVRINLNVYEDKAQLSLSVTYDGDRWKFLEPDMLIEIDGEIFKLEGSDPYRSTWDDGSRYDSILANVTPKMVDACIGAEKLRLFYDDRLITLNQVLVEAFYLYWDEVMYLTWEELQEEA